MSLARRWIAAPELRRTYLALLLPGGAAIEQCIEARTGTSHLLEHLFYRQNELDGHPLDDLGASLALLTTAETQQITAAVAPDDASRISMYFERWCRVPRFPVHIVAGETDVVIDEVEQANRNPGRALWAQLLTRLAPASHLSSDLGGDAASLRAMSVEQIAESHRRVIASGGALVALGPVSPWSTAGETAPRSWTPPASTRHGERRYAEIRTRGVGHSVIGSARMFAGLARAEVIGTYGRYASLTFGRVHEAQRRFHCELNLRYLQLELRVYREVAVLAAFARCPAELSEPVAELVESLLCTLGESFDPERMRRCALHHLLATRDDPERRALEEGTRALYGVETLDEVIARTRAMTTPELVETADRAALGEATTVLFVEDRSP